MTDFQDIYLKLRKAHIEQGLSAAESSELAYHDACQLKNYKKRLD